MRARGTFFNRDVCTVAIILVCGVIAHAQNVQPSPLATLGQTTPQRTTVKADTAALDYTTSWIGNSFGGYSPDPNKILWHIASDVDASYVTPDGKVYTNAGWDEGGRALTTYKDGQIINPLNQNDINNNDGAAYQNGGVAVAADDKYIYQAQYTGIVIKNVPDQTIVGGANTPTQLTGSKTLYKSVAVIGETIANKKLYISESDQNVIDIFDTTTWALVKTLPIKNPARVAVDCLGGVWVTHVDQTVLPPHVNFGTYSGPVIDHYNADGVLLNSITVPDSADVTAIWIDQYGKDGQDRLFVGDDGPDQNVKVYTDILWGNPKLIATFGVKGGTSVGPHYGAVGHYRFHGITGVGTDAHNNLYITQNGIGPAYQTGTASTGGLANTGRGTVIYAYALGDSLDGRDSVAGESDESFWTTRGSHLNWTLNGLEFVSMTTIDPGSDEQAYDADHKFHMYWDRPTGQEAHYASDTIDPVRFPLDIRLTNNGSNNGQSGQIRRIQGKRFLFVQGQSGSYIAIYRFNDNELSDIAIPCGGIDYGAFLGIYNDWAHQPLNGEFIWRDLNNDGTTEPDEFLQPANPSHVDGQQWWVDNDGDIWQVAYHSAIEKSIRFRRYHLQGFDQNGAPIYDYNHVDYFTVPSDLTDVQSVVFDPEASTGGTLYLAGNQYQPTYAGTFTKLARYDHWDEGNRKPTWVIDVTWSPDPNNIWAPNQFRTAGDYIFVGYQEPHYVLIYRKKDGSYVGQLTPGANIGGPVYVGNTDEPLSIGAYQRPDGEYVITGEDDYQDKTIMYRWNAKNLTPPTLPAAPSGFAGVGDDEAADLSWTAVPGALTYQVKRSATPTGPFALVENGIFQTNFEDSGLTNGKTYYYVISAFTQQGASVDSAPISVTTAAKGTTYEAESAILTGGAQVNACPLHCSGGADVNNLNGTTGSGDTTISFKSVVAPAAGTYAVRVYYGVGDTGSYTLNLSVNGATAVAVAPLNFTYGADMPYYVTLNLPLKAGANTIVVSNPSGGNVSSTTIDRILVPFTHN